MNPMRLAIPIGIALFIDIYAFQALRSIMQNWSSLSKSFATIIFWLIPLLLICFMFLTINGGTATWEKAVKINIRAFFFIAYFSKLFVVVILLVDDIRRFGVWIYELLFSLTPLNKSRSRFMTNFALFMGSIPFVSLLYGIIRNPYRYKRHFINVPIPNLPPDLEGLKIVQISDIHSGSFTFKEPIKNAIEIINSEEADLVFFTGDLVNSLASEMEPYIDIFDKIRAKHGVYSITGNHDYGQYYRWKSKEEEAQNFEEFKELHKKLGWDLLLNENRILEFNQKKIAIIGVENFSALDRFPKYGDLDKAYQGAENADLKLLLSHDPSHWDYEVNQKYKDIAITFAGHTHGFQLGIEIPGFIKWSPAKYMYKQWAGLYEKNNQFLYVNRGLGFLGYPGRIGILPEITVIKLQNA